MQTSLREAFWRLEAKLLAPGRGLKGLRGTLAGLSDAVEEALHFLPSEEQKLVRQELAHLYDLCLWVWRCRWRSVLTRGWARKHLPVLLSSCSEVDPESTLQQQGFACCSGIPRLLQALRSRCLLLTAISGLLVFIQANVTGPPFSPTSAVELIEMKHDKEGRARHPDLYPSQTAATTAAGAAAQGVCRCCCCCFYCGFCPRKEALSATAAAATTGSLRQKRCYCEFKIEEDSPLLGDPTETTVTTSERLQATQALLTIDGEAIYEDVKGLSYLWFSRLLLRMLESLQLAEAPRAFPESQGKPQVEANHPAFEGPLTLFLWKSRVDFFLQRALTSGGGASGAFRGTVAPSLVSSLLFDFAAVLQQLQLLPESFNCSATEAVDMEKLLKAVDFGSFELPGKQQQIKQFKSDVANLVQNQQARFCLVPPLSAAANAASDAAVTVPSAEKKVRLLLRQSLDNPDVVDLAVLLPDPAWMTSQEKCLLLLELALRLAVFGRVEIFDSVNNLACKAFGVEFMLTGAPGIRRKYQQEALPQLVVGATRKGKGLQEACEGEGAAQVEGDAQVEGPLFTTNGPSVDHGSSGSNSNSASSDNSKSSSNSSSTTMTSALHSNSTSGEEQPEAASEVLPKAEEPSEATRRLWRLEDVRKDTDILERPKLSNAADWETFERPLGVVEQALLLCKSRTLLESNPCNDPLALEEVGAVVSRALILPPSGLTAASSSNSDSSSNSNSNREYYKTRHSFLLSQAREEFLDEPNCQLLSPDWVVFSGGLWLRCRAEFHRTKTVERACLQLHALCEQINDADPPACYRLFGLLFQADLPSWWELQREVAMRMMRIGATITAADKFVELKMWEEAADCLVASDRRADARTLLEKQIGDRPTPHLLCTLGDLERHEDPERAEQLYKQAWELSKNRYARAQRSLGSFYFVKQRMHEAAAAFRLATAANCLHPQSWFTLGCCCMRLGEDVEARAAFARVVAIDPEEGDAWANLAAVHCKREAWVAAQQCITEAAKYRRESWRIWQTFISICVRTRDVQAITRGLRMLVQINAKSHIDSCIYSILEELVLFELKHQLLGGKEGQDTKQMPGILRQALSCLQYLAQHISDSAELFRVYGVLLVKANKHADAIYMWLKEFRTLQASLTRGDASPRAKMQMTEQQIASLERALSLLKAFCPQSEKRIELLQQLKTTVETHRLRIAQEAGDANKRLDLVLKQIGALQEQQTAT